MSARKKRKQPTTRQRIARLEDRLVKLRETNHVLQWQRKRAEDTNKWYQMRAELFEPKMYLEKEKLRMVRATILKVLEGLRPHADTGAILTAVRDLEGVLNYTRGIDVPAGMPDAKEKAR